MEEWVEAYRTGTTAQIYVPSMSEGIFLSWRLTCDGTAAYTLDVQPFGKYSAPITYVSESITEGVMYYTFAPEVTNGWYDAPITVWKGFDRGIPIDENEQWKAQATLTAEQAVEIANHYFLGSSTDIQLKVTGCMLYLGQCFYDITAYSMPENQYEGQVAVSADGTVFMWMSMVDGSWIFDRDDAAWKIVPGDKKVNLEELWRERREKTPYQPPQLQEYFEKISTPSSLILGTWHSLQSGEWTTNGKHVLYGDRYLFEADGTYTFSENISSDVARRYTSGKWWIEGNTLYLSAAKILEYHGDDSRRIALFNAQSMDKILPSRRYQYIFRTESERQVTSYQLTIVKEGIEARNLIIGEYSLWRDSVNINDMLSFRDYI